MSLDEDLLYSTHAEDGGSGQPVAFVLRKGARAPRAWELALQGESSGGALPGAGGPTHRPLPPPRTPPPPPLPPSRPSHRGTYRECDRLLPLLPLLLPHAADMQCGTRKRLRVQPGYGYAHPACGMRPPPGVPSDAALQFDLQLARWYPAAQVCACMHVQTSRCVPVPVAAHWQPASPLRRRLLLQEAVRYRTHTHTKMPHRTGTCVWRGRRLIQASVAGEHKVGSSTQPKRGVHVAMLHKCAVLFRVFWGWS